MRESTGNGENGTGEGDVESSESDGEGGEVGKNSVNTTYFRLWV